MLRRRLSKQARAKSRVRSCEVRQALRLGQQPAPMLASRLEPRDAFSRDSGPVALLLAARARPGRQEQALRLGCFHLPGIGLSENAAHHPTCRGCLVAWASSCTPLRTARGAPAPGQWGCAPRLPRLRVWCRPAMAQRWSQGQNRPPARPCGLARARQLSPRLRSRHPQEPPSPQCPSLRLTALGWCCAGGAALALGAGGLGPCLLPASQTPAPSSRSRRSTSPSCPRRQSKTSGPS